jgi:hypothetical protein
MGFNVDLINLIVNLKIRCIGNVKISSLIALESLAITYS